MLAILCILWAGNLLMSFEGSVLNHEGQEKRLACPSSHDLELAASFL
jgi:hypothetical protein